MASIRAWQVGLLAAVGLVGCSSEPTAPRSEKILGLPETESWVFGELEAPAYVVRTEHNVPHVYAHNVRDLGFVLGFVIARDRYFMLELTRRLMQGRLSELLGDAALEIDLEQRGSGSLFVSQAVDDALGGDMEAYVEGFAAGINAYIERLKTDEVVAPSELQLASILLGVSDPVSLLEPFTRLDVAAMFSVVFYQSSYETGDVGRAATAAALPTLFEGAAYQDLRRQGAIVDLWGSIAPLIPLASAPGFEVSSTSGLPFRSVVPHVPKALLDRVVARNDHQQRRFGRHIDGFGSNAWAVSGAGAAGGQALLAGDGHLSLAVPSFMYRFGIDTEVFGGGDIHQLGASPPPIPITGVGTNGFVAWSQTQLSADNTDWYVEEIQLNSEGLPARARWQGEWVQLDKHDEEYVVANVEVLESVGRTEVWPRWSTFDGRLLADIEGREALPGEPLGPGEALVNMRGSYVVPGDVDGDGVITGISFDYLGFDAGTLIQGYDALAKSRDVYEFAENGRGLIATSLNYAAADSAGNAFYGAIQGYHCRGYLERNADGSWADGADPNLLLDGSRYGAMTLPVKNNEVDDTPSDDPYRCAVPYEDIPQVFNPPQGYVVTANNDPAGLTFDEKLYNDKHYFGGPWNNGFRAKAISDGLAQAVAEGTADIDKMAEIQAASDSPLGALLLAPLLAAIDHAASLDAPSDPADQRIAALYAGDAAAIDEVRERLQAWADGGFEAPSGVKTFYNPEVSEEERRDAVATMIFNAWLPRVIQGVFDDEGLPGVFHGGNHGRIRALYRFLEARGSDAGFASHNPETGESIFFDVLGTDEVETSNEVILRALVDALSFLRSTPAEDAPPATGGFGTDDMDAWRWGMRHYVKFTSLLGDFIEDGDQFAAITNGFAITTKVLPLDDDIGPGDPRAALQWFPRHGDNYTPDAANPGFSGTQFDHGSGAVMRMVIAPNGDATKGINIIPGGQSGITDSPYFADQAALWLANQTTPMRFSVDDVVAGAQGRETYMPR